MGVSPFPAPFPTLESSAEKHASHPDCCCYKLTASTSVGYSACPTIPSPAKVSFCSHSLPIIASLYTLFLTLGPGKLATLLSFSHSGSLPQEEASEVYRLPASPNLSYFQSQKKSCPPPHPLSDSSTFLFNAERLRAQGLQPDSWCLHSRSSTHSLCDFR